jgi:hypothetical protein
MASDEAEHLAGLRVTSELALGEDFCSVHRYLKDAAAAPVQPDVGVGKFTLELGGQTGRPRLVVSNDAERDVDSHDSVAPSASMPSNHSADRRPDQP